MPSRFYFGGLTSNIAAPAGLLASQLVVALTGLLMTRYLAPPLKGSFTGTYVWASLVFLGFGLSLPHAALLASTPGHPALVERKLLAGLFGFCATGSVIVAVLLHIGGLLATFRHFLLFLTLPPAMLAFELHSSRLLGSGSRYVRFRLGQASTFMAATVLAIIFLPTLSGLLFALLASYGVMWLLFSPPVTHGATVELAPFLSWARAAHPGLILTTLAGRVDIMLVALLFPPGQVGLYAAASAIPSLGSFLGLGIGTTMIPRIRSGHARREVAYGYSAVLLFSTAMSAMVVWRADDIVGGLFGDRYARSATLLRILGLAILPWNLSSFGSQVLVGLDRAREQTTAQLLAVLVLLGFTGLSVVVGQISLAAWGNVLAYTVSSAMQFCAVARRLRSAPLGNRRAR